MTLPEITLQAQRRTIKKQSECAGNENDKCEKPILQYFVV